MDEKIITKCAEKYGTPLYLFDTDILRKETERFRKNLGPDTGLCFAMKANPFLVREMAEVTDRIEVCSAGEYRICREDGIPVSKLFLSGVLKEREDTLKMLEECGSDAVYTAESPQQFRMLSDWAQEHQKEIRIFPRLTSGNQFGMDEENILQLIRESSRMPYVRIEGIHYFSGTQKRKKEILQKEIRRLDEFLLKTEHECGIRIPGLEYGSGTAVPYFADQEEEVFTEEGIRFLAACLGEMHWKGNITVEMGRALSAMCGSYITEVKDIKHTDNKAYAIVDGGIHQLSYDGQIRGMYRPHIRHIPGSRNEEERTEEENWTVCGSLCTVNDVLCTKLPLKNLKCGDLLVFERTGAYSVYEGMSLFLSHELPCIVKYSSAENAVKIRDRIESWVFNR